VVDTNPSTAPGRCPFPRPLADLPGADPRAVWQPPAEHPGPVVPIELPGGRPAWGVVGLAECVEVYRGGAEYTRADADGISPYAALAPLILAHDGDHHRYLRRIVAKDFTPRRVAKFGPHLERLTTQCLKEMTAKGEPADLIGDFSFPLSLHAIGDMLGTPVEDRHMFRAWGDGLLDTSPDQAQVNAAAVEAMAGYVGRLMASRAQTPAEDLLSAITSNMASSEIGPEEAALLTASLVIAGWETTAGGLAALVYWLLTTTGGDGNSLYSWLCRHPQHIDTAVEEALRIVPNSWFDSGQPRRAARNTVLGGVTIRKGDIVIPIHDTANLRIDPDTIDLTRSAEDNNHIAFGSGAHFCLGSHLARAEFRTALEILTREMPALRLAVPADEVVWSTSTTIRRPEKLPVAWTPATS
jgi:nocardicin N-oxygenase